MKIPKSFKVVIRVIVVLLVLVVASSLLSYRHMIKRIEGLKTKAVAGPVEWEAISIKGIVGSLETDYSGSTSRASFKLRLNENPPPGSKFTVFIGLGEQVAAKVAINDNEFKMNGDEWVAEVHTTEYVSAIKYSQAKQWVLMVADPQPEAKEGTRLTN